MSEVLFLQMDRLLRALESSINKLGFEDKYSDVDYWYRLLPASCSQGDLEVLVMKRVYSA